MIYSFKRDFKKGLLPNSITTLGLLTAPAIMIASQKNDWPLALLLFTLAWLADFFDGWLARKLKLNTQIGAFYDPLADKIFTMSFLLWFWSEINIILIFSVLSISVGLTVLRIYKWYYGTKKNVDYSIMASISGKAKTNLEKSSFALLLLGQALLYCGIFQDNTWQTVVAGANCLLLASVFFACFSLHSQMKRIG